MKKLLQILKINLLALIAIPLLLLATCCKLISKAFEKLALFLGMLAVATAVSLIVYEVASHPESVLAAVGWIIAILAAFGLVIALLIWIGSLISGFVSSAYTLLIAVFNHLYDITYSGYLHLFTACENDYRLLSLNGRKGLNAVLCLIFTLLKAISWLIVSIVSVALPLAIGGSVLLVIGTLWNLNSNVSKGFGMNLIQFLGKCSVPAVIGGILLYLIYVGLIITAIMALAIEWFEWAQELKMTDQEISGEVSRVTEHELKLASSTAEQAEKNLGLLSMVQAHVDGLDSLGEQVTDMLEKKDNPLLRSYWGIYMRNLTPIVKECSQQKGISNERLRQLVPQIQLLDKQRDDVQSLLAKMERELESPAGASVFFVGCDTLEKLEKRYRSLSKTYHPDEAAGDTATFQKMRAEYERLRVAMQPPQ